MTKKSLFRARFLLLPLFFPAFIGQVDAQDCTDPGSICPQLSTDSASTSEGAPVGVPGSFCFDEAPNALFYSFNTLDQEQFSDIVYDDSTAFLSLTIDSCAVDTLAGTGVNIAVFEAGDACDPGSYGQLVTCRVEEEQSAQIFLDGLMPSTTYYVLISGVLGEGPEGVASNCDILLSVTGPAVEYDLDATPPTPQSQSLFPGASAELNVNPIFDSYEWDGEELSPLEGPSVTASPSEFGAFNYTAQTEINGCPFQANFLVTVVPPISPFNAFTPNSDGFNDTWEIDRITEWPNAQIVVYSRWGAKVFQATNYRNDWDGDDLPAATYYYVIELNPIDFNTEPITGSVTIVR